MAWRDFLLAVSYWPAAFLLIYLAILLTGLSGYLFQVIVLRNGGVAAAALRHRWVRAFAGIGGVLCLYYGFFAFVVISSIATLLALPSPVVYTAGAAASICAVTLFVDGVIFATYPRFRPWRPAIGKVELPTQLMEVHRTRRARIALHIYWFMIWKNVTLPVLILACLAALLRLGGAPGDAKTSTALGWVVGGLVTAAIVVVESRAPASERALPDAAAVIVLAEVNHAMRGSTPRMAPIAADGDPLDWYRFRLRRVSVLIDRHAGSLDAITRGAGQNPVAVVLRSTAEYLRAFITNESSLVGRLPSDVRKIITNLTSVLVGPARPEPYLELAKAVNAFGQAGDTSAAPPRRRLAFGTLLARAGQGSEALQKILPLLATLVLIVLFVLGRIEMNDLGGLLRP